MEETKYSRCCIEIIQATEIYVYESQKAIVSIGEASTDIGRLYGTRNQNILVSF